MEPTAAISCASIPAVFREDGTLQAFIGEDWLQGRTAYGGVSAAVALAAAKMEHGDLPPLRSAQIAFIGPLSGAVVAEPVLLRRGKNSAFIGCDIVGADGVGLRALFLFMTSRTSVIEYHDLPAPAYPLEETKLLNADQLPTGFLNNFDVVPWQQMDGTIRAWRRLKQREALDPEVELVAIADALPPAAMSLAKEWGPISTTTWQLNLMTDTPRTTDGWWLLEARALAAHNGASSQTMTIWNRNGEAVATATQSVALFV
jgi:Thioesterase-like superfamily